MESSTVWSVLGPVVLGVNVALVSMVWLNISSRLKRIEDVLESMREREQATSTRVTVLEKQIEVLERK